MLDWMTRWRLTTRTQFEPSAEPATSQPAIVGKGAFLYKYLNGRYADVVVLTFAEIEDLLGFSLPHVARSSEDWWTRPDPDAMHPRVADSWISANRTARPNLQALTVVFDRTA
jgi:hypothetical protein